MKIAVVNDSLIACKMLQDVLRQRPDYEIIWTAYNGPDAIELCRRNKPDVVLMDMIMPGMDGPTATKLILETTACAILVVTASITENTSKIFEAMGCGAMDVATTPRSNHPDDAIELFRKLDQIQKLHFSGLGTKTEPAAAPKSTKTSEQKLILLGASAGGPTALAQVLSNLPPDLPAGIVIAQHMDSRFDDAFVSWLADQTRWPLRKAKANDQVVNGTILVAGAEHHLVFRPGNQLRFVDQPRFAYIPSIDVLFSSAAQHWRGILAAALLTGMGSDGAQGLKRLREAGHLTIAQDKASSALYGMPKVAAEIGAAQDILPLQQIPPRLISFLK